MGMCRRGISRLDLHSTRIARVDVPALRRHFDREPVERGASKHAAAHLWRWNVAGEEVEEDEEEQQLSGEAEVLAEDETHVDGRRRG